MQLSGVHRSSVKRRQWYQIHYAYSVCFVWKCTLVASAEHVYMYGSRMHHQLIEVLPFATIRYDSLLLNTVHPMLISPDPNDDDHHASSTSSTSSAISSKYSPSPSPRALTGIRVRAVVCSRAGQSVACGVGGNESGGEKGEDDGVSIGVATDDDDDDDDDWRDALDSGVRSEVDIAVSGVIVVVVVMVVGTL